MPRLLHISALVAVALLLPHPAISHADPVADPQAVVVFRSLRVTVLTSTLLRVEYAGNGSFDDRATFQVVNRRLPVPRFTVSYPNASALQIQTDDLVLTYSGAPLDKCSSVHVLTDVNDPVRSPAYPNGVAASDQSVCCALCTQDPYCSAWVYDPSGRFCYPLQSFSSLRANVSDRNVGVATLPLTITFTAVGPDGKPTGPMTWTPGLENVGNLNGTYSSLDCYSTPMQCDQQYRDSMRPGLLSTSGWYLLDDSGTARTEPDASRPAGLPAWWTLQLSDAVDWYFHVHRPGPDHFRQALGEWALVLGAPPMPPRTAFGVWWSRYYPYSQSSIVDEVLSGYANYSIPLSSLVMDMDWHDEPKLPGCQSWGNYDVNTTLFPDFTGFTQAVHEYGVVTGHPLKISLNIHPNTGVDYCDHRYDDFATAMGLDPSSKRTIECDMGNRSFADALFAVYLDQQPLHAVDVWWTDYGGCGLSGNNPLLWSNRVMYEHAKYGRHVRGQAFSRYGGLGNHRYPHGFSGDSFQHEVVLYFQIKTTQTAANVLFGYWSHDIGGFHNGQGCPGDADPTNTTGAELLLRWLQFGAVAPILRTHCDHCERRIWLFPFFEHMRDALVLRNALLPYIYTAAHAMYETAVAAVHPLYYDFAADPHVWEPQVLERQYMFGDAILASPISAISGQPAATVSWSTYLPGTQAWADWNGTHVYPAQTGGEAGVEAVGHGSTAAAAAAAAERAVRTVTASYGPGDVPLFVRAGSIVPMQTAQQYADVNFPSPLVWAVWPGAAAAQAVLYEDVGGSDSYQGGQYVVTNASTLGDTAQSSVFVFNVAPAAVPASLPDGFPATRAHVLQVRGFAQHWQQVTADVNGLPIPAGRGERGYYVVPAAEHSLAQPEGALVVSTGPGFSSFAPLTITLRFK